MVTKKKVPLPKIKPASLIVKIIQLVVKNPMSIEDFYDALPKSNENSIRAQVFYLKKHGVIKLLPDGKYALISYEPLDKKLKEAMDWCFGTYRRLRWSWLDERMVKAVAIMCGRDPRDKEFMELYSKYAPKIWTEWSKSELEAKRMFEEFLISLKNQKK